MSNDHPESLVRREFDHFKDEAAALYESYKARPMLRGIFHLIAFFGACVAGGILIANSSGGLQLASAIIYGIGLCSALGTSAIYHRVRWRPRAYKWVRKLDHSMIFVLVAATYTPFLLVALESGWRIGWMIGVWVLAVTGIVLRMFIDDIRRGVLVGFYVGLGSAAVGILPFLVSRVPLSAIILMIIGGVLYWIGGLVYLFKRPNPFPRVLGFHEVFHALVVTAAVCHFAAIWPVVTLSMPSS